MEIVLFSLLLPPPSSPSYPPLPPPQRTSVLQWTAAVSLALGPTHLPSYLPALLTTPYRLIENILYLSDCGIFNGIHDHGRETTDSNKTGGEALHSLAQEVMEVMKEVCGREAFSRGYSVTHLRALKARENRRKQAALEVSYSTNCQLFSLPSLPPFFLTFPHSLPSL